MRSPLLKCSRRPLATAGALIWVSLSLAWGQCLKIEDLQVACIGEARQGVTLKITNQTDCIVPWITLHPAEAFDPSIIQLTTPLKPNETAIIRSTLMDGNSGKPYTFTMLTHCLRDGTFCDPCRQEVRITLAECDPKPPIRPRAPLDVQLRNDRFYLSVPLEPNQRPIVESSDDMRTWKEVITTAEPNESSTISVEKPKDQRRRYYRVRSEPKS